MKSLPFLLGIIAFASLISASVVPPVQRYRDITGAESIPAPPDARCLLQPGESYVRMEHGQDASMLQRWKKGSEWNEDMGGDSSLVDLLENSFHPTQSPLTASSHDSAFSPRSIAAQWQPLSAQESFVVPPTLRQHDTVDVWVVRAENRHRWFHRWIGADRQFSFDLRLRSNRKLYFHRMMSSRVAKSDLKELLSTEPVTPLRPLTQVFVQKLDGRSLDPSAFPSSSSSGPVSFVCPDTTVYLFRYRFRLPSRLPADDMDKEMSFELSLNRRKRFFMHKQTKFRSEKFTLLGQPQDLPAWNRDYTADLQNYAYKSILKSSAVHPNSRERLLHVSRDPIHYQDNTVNGVWNAKSGSPLMLRFHQMQVLSPSFDDVRMTKVYLVPFGLDADHDSTFDQTLVAAFRASDAPFCKDNDGEHLPQYQFLFEDSQHWYPRPSLEQQQIRHPRDSDLAFTAVPGEVDPKRMRRLEGEMYTYFVQVAPEKVKDLADGWYLVKIENSVDTGLDRVGSLKHHVYRAFNAVKARTVMTGLFYLSKKEDSAEDRDNLLGQAESANSLDSPRRQPIVVDSEFTTPVLKPAVNPLGPFGSPFPDDKSFTLDAGFGLDSLPRLDTIPDSLASAKSLPSAKSIPSAVKSFANTEPLSILGSRQLSGSLIAEGSQRGARSFPLDDLEDISSPDSSPRENRPPSTKSTPRIGKAYTTNSEPLNRQPTMSVTSVSNAKSEPPFPGLAATSSVSVSGPSRMYNTVADEADYDIDMSMGNEHTVSANDRTVSFDSLPSEEVEYLPLDSGASKDRTTSTVKESQDQSEATVSKGRFKFRNPLRPAVEVGPLGTPPLSPLKSGLALLLGERRTVGGGHVEYPSEIAVKTPVKSFAPLEASPSGAGTEDRLDDTVSSDWPDFAMSPPATGNPLSPKQLMTASFSPRNAVLGTATASRPNIVTPSVSPAGAMTPPMPSRNTFSPSASMPRSNIPASRSLLPDRPARRFSLEEEQNFLIDQFHADALRETYGPTYLSIPPPAQSMLRPSAPTLVPSLAQGVRPTLAASSAPQMTGHFAQHLPPAMVRSARQSSPVEFSVSPLQLDESDREL